MEQSCKLTGLYRGECPEEWAASDRTDISPRHIFGFDPGRFNSLGSSRRRTSPYVEPWPIGGLSLSDLSTFTSVLLPFFIAFFSFFIFLSIFDLSFFLPIALLRLHNAAFGTRQFGLVDVCFGKLAQTCSERTTAFRHTPHYFACDILGDIPRPSFGRVEGDDADRVVELAGQ